MGISIAVLNLMKELGVRDSIIMLYWGLATLSLSSFMDYQEKENEKKLIKKK